MSFGFLEDAGTIASEGIGSLLDRTSDFYHGIEAKAGDLSQTIDQAKLAAQKANSALDWWSDPVHVVPVVLGVLLANVLIIRFVDGHRAA